MSFVECIVVLGAFTCIAVLADESEDARYTTQLETNDLQTQEKLLLQQEDDLNRSIDESKRKIKYLTDDLEGQLAERSRLRHQIIVTRIKLLH